MALAHGLRMRSIHRVGPLVLVALLAGCPRSGDQVAPAPSADGGTTMDDAGGGAPPDLAPSPGDPEPPMVPFDQVFRLGEVRCASQGSSVVTVRFADPRYQFGDCTVGLARQDGGSAMVQARVVASTGGAAWDSTVTPADGGLSMRLHQARTGVIVFDWSADPLDVQLDFTAADGSPRRTTLTLQPAALADVLSFGTPHVGRDYFFEDATGKVQIERRSTVDGTPVLRQGETIGVALPLALAAGTTADWLFVRPMIDHVSVLRPSCYLGSGLFADATGQPRMDGWLKPDGSSALFAGGDSPASGCDNEPFTSVVDGLVRFSLDPRLPMIEAPLLVRFAAADGLKDEVTAEAKLFNDAFVEVTVRNDADYSLEALTLAFDFRCVAAPATASPFRLYHPPARLNTATPGLTREASVQPGQIVRWSSDEVRAQLLAKAPACDSHQWTVDSLVVSEPFFVRSAVKPITPFTISLAN
jgi:hypothetical protein